MKKRVYYRGSDGKLHWVRAYDPPITLSLRESRKYYRYFRGDRYRLKPMSAAPRAK
jgi:hypothetical protein